MRISDWSSDVCSSDLEDDVTAFLQAADAAGPLDACIFNVGGNVNFPLLETTERVFRKVWELSCYAGFLTGREAARLMLPRGRGRSEEHTSELQALMRISYAVFSLKKKKTI